MNNEQFNKSVEDTNSPAAKRIEELQRERDEARAEAARLRAAIQRALDDEESGTGWGPDVTVCAYLREALAAKGKNDL